MSAAIITGLMSFAVAPMSTAGPVADSAMTGFAIPFAGAPAFEHLAPTQVTRPGQLNAALGQPTADRIAQQIGLTRADALSDKQSRDLLTGGGVGGNHADATIIDACIRILTNTTGRPLHSEVDGHLVSSVLASYGLYVDANGRLQSPANADAPTRQVNSLIAPGGFVGNWLRDNGATRTLAALYRSAHTIEAAFGFAAQQMSGAAQLVTNTKGGVSTQVGMSMAPPLWIVNFALLYVVRPSLAAAMPAHWAPIPPEVAQAIHSNPTGHVPYALWASSFD